MDRKHRLILLFSLVLASCQTAPSLKKISLTAHSSPICHSTVRELDRGRPLEVLDTIAQLYQMGCYNETIQLGTLAQKSYQDKDYSLSAEVSSVFIPEGSNTTYVMESYERAYLTFLIARSHFQLGNPEAGEVELRKAYDEQQADIYNSGDDPINLILLASQWENSSTPYIARSFWQRAKETSTNKSIQAIAQARITSFDNASEVSSQKWFVYRVGYFPKLDWDFKFSKVGDSYYDVTGLTPPTATCQSKTGLTVSTQSWLGKINRRYQNNYHPLLNLKSWVRLPIGVVYGTTVLVAGAGVGVGGCILSKGSDKVCEASMKLGFNVASKVDDVVNYTLSPDIRHWSRIPGAVIVTKVPLEEEPCFKKLSNRDELSISEL